MSDQMDTEVAVKEIKNNNEDEVKDNAKKENLGEQLDVDENEPKPKRRRLSLDEPLYYKMDHSKRGLALILNHENFDQSTGLPQRKGTENDVKSITAIFEKLKFKVERKDDLTLLRIYKWLKKWKTTDFEDYDCLFIFVLTHGNLLSEVKRDTRSGNSSQELCEETVLWAKDKYYNPNKILKAFLPNQCPTLNGKPKVVIIQACRGRKVDRGYVVKKKNCETKTDGESLKVERPNTHGKPSNIEGPDPIEYRLPLNIDFLCAWSTLRGYCSYRNEETGSYYIQFLCATLKKYYDQLSFCDILTIVNGRVANEFEAQSSKKQGINKKKQTSTFTSELTKILSFSSKIDDQLVDKEEIIPLKPIGENNFLVH